LNSQLPNNETGKMYYSISEVASMLNLKAYVLRFWEKEFPHLRPKKNRAGNRTYQQKDIEQLLHIKHLLYDKGFTIDGARNFLKGDSKTPESKGQSDMATTLLKEIRAELDDILKLIP
jgi:DNA-binding transcriptional MerR regulator